MSDTIPSNAPCGDPVRLRLYEALTSAFAKPVESFVGDCPLCGAKGMALSNRNDPGCIAQKALTQKRHTAAEGHPVAYGSPVNDGKAMYSMTDQKCAILVETDAAIFTGKVVPTAPLPQGAEIRTDLGFLDLLDRVMTEPRVPYFLANFDKKASLPFVMSTSAATIVINGTDPVQRVDRARLRSLVALVEEFGVEAVKLAAQVRSTSSRDPKESRRLSLKLRRDAPGLVPDPDDTESDPRTSSRIAEVPSSKDDPVLGWAEKIVAHRIRRASGSQTSDTASAA